MNLFRQKKTVTVLAFVAIYACATNSALADSPFKSRNSGWDHHDNKGFSSSFNNRRDNRNSWDNRRSGNRFRQAASNHHYTPTRNHDYWSVNINLGSGYTSARYGTSYNSSFNNFNNYGNHNYNRAPVSRNTRVIVNQPTVIYVNNSVGNSSRRYNGNSTYSTERTLLRDIHGNCFERTYDSRGYETRIQVNAAACNF